MTLPRGWKKTVMPMSGDSFRYIKYITRDGYKDTFYVDINDNYNKTKYTVSPSGVITGAQTKSFRTLQQATNYAIKIMQYINFGESKGVLK